MSAQYDREARLRRPSARPTCCTRRGRGGMTQALVAGPYTFTLDGPDLVDQTHGVRINYRADGAWVIDLPIREPAWDDAKDAAEHLARTYQPIPTTKEAP